MNSVNQVFLAAQKNTLTTPLHPSVKGLTLPLFFNMNLPSFNSCGVWAQLVSILVVWAWNLSWGNHNKYLVDSRRIIVFPSYKQLSIRCIPCKPLQVQWKTCFKRQEHVNTFLLLSLRRLQEKYNIWVRYLKMFKILKYSKRIDKPKNAWIDSLFCLCPLGHWKGKPHTEVITVSHTVTVLIVC